ncbi:hypothetical protein A3709_19255 [Halioglobus sp. HI00S01]|nr:hypothetical protein A3709_19255 [Halioglobus sp. HI00S01]
MLDDKGNRYEEHAYNGYGIFGGVDYYSLVDIMNGGSGDRERGIDLCFGNNGDHDPALKLPKLVTLNCKTSWADLPNSPSCEAQGFFYSWLEESGVVYKYKKSAGGDDIDWTITQDGNWVADVETETVAALSVAVLTGVVVIPDGVEAEMGKYYGEANGVDKPYAFHGRDVDDGVKYFVESFLVLDGAEEEYTYERKANTASRVLAQSLVLLLSGVVPYDYDLLTFNDAV